MSRISISDYNKDLLNIINYTYYDITVTTLNSYITLLLDKYAPSKISLLET